MKEERILRERKTIETMIEIYCSHHCQDIGSDKKPCPKCQDLLNYAFMRLERCPHLRKSNMKPTCGQCPIHCYAPKFRAEIKEVMKFSGPRLILKAPFFSFMHIIDGINYRMKTKN